MTTPATASAASLRRSPQTSGMYDTTAVRTPPEGSFHDSTPPPNDRADGRLSSPPRGPDQLPPSPGLNAVTGAANGRFNPVDNTTATQSILLDAIVEQDEQSTPPAYPQSAFAPPGGLPALPAEHDLSPYRASHTSPSLTTRALDLPTTPGGTATTQVKDDYDWAAFIASYAAGRWDPHRTPRFPGRRSAQPGSPSAPLPPPSGPPQPSNSAPSLVSPSDPPSPPPPSGPLTGSGSASVPPTRGIAARMNRTGPGVLALPKARLRSSWDQRVSLHSPATPATPSTPAVAADQMASAAAIRWAGARVSVAPLVLPSPERELTDPMHGWTTTIPGSHPDDIEGFTTPGGTRLNRFWTGTQDIDEDDGYAQREYNQDRRPRDYLDGPSDCEYEDEVGGRSPEAMQRRQRTPRGVEVGVAPSLDGATPTPDSDTPTPKNEIEASLAAPQPEPKVAPSKSEASKVDSALHDSVYDPPTPPAPRRRSTMPLASAPLPNTGAHSTGDYFSPTDTPPERSGLPRRYSGESRTPEEDAPLTAPVMPRRSNLSRQTSAPLPVLPLSTGAPLRDGTASARHLRAAKEEQLFNELGYLIPPMPNDELDRRRALYKFNIWNTGRDPNFDRIVHLAKLVFATKIVTISLSDGYIEWFKAQSGMKENYWMRSASFSAHAILQRGDEPLVVLDAQADWRFARSPLVTGEPHVRFCAIAPIRTTDGHNIGSLCVLDDRARAQFSPRQRHTLKEFAAVAMRELELWRDKIQLRIRDRIQSSMEQFTRECLEIDGEGPGLEGGLARAGSMERIYERAARLVKRTLDVEDAFVLDVTHSDVLETITAEGTVTVARHGADGPTAGHMSLSLTGDELAGLNDFFVKYPDGRISETIVPACLRGFMPTHIQYALTVPILNVDKRPFALLCAYNASEQTKRFLEGHELSYLRAIGVIILSAVLKRRMILADKAKSLFISNISHELRTPLHGILAAAELLADSSLNPSQASFLQTVQACGTSLVETVNHVLDFTKLSGNTRSGGVDGTIRRSRVDLMQLVEEAVEGSWIGHQARMSALESDIGSVYAPPKALGAASDHVETVVDIGRRPGGWQVKCEKGGIRRVLMNIFGNSLKFTSNGYIHVSLREIDAGEEEEHNTKSNKITLELSVLDTGKGISQDFLKNQLFHPFSQENPLQTGTGLGLAIVSSIVRSSAVNGNIDVSSAEGVGTEIRITFTAERVSSAAGDDAKYSEMEPLALTGDSAPAPTVSLCGFDPARRGDALLHTVLSTYVLTWGLAVSEYADVSGDIAILNGDVAPIAAATAAHDPRRPFVILTGERGSAALEHAIAEYERVGGFARLVYKPGGPSRIRAALKLCLHTLHMAQRPRVSSLDTASAPTPPPMFTVELARRHSEDKTRLLVGKRPLLGPRALTMEGTIPTWEHPASVPEEETMDEHNPALEPEPTHTPKSEPTPDPLTTTTPALQRAHTSAPLRTPAPLLRHSHSGSSESSVNASDADGDVSVDADDDDTVTLVPIAGGGSVLRASMTSHTRPGTLRVLVIEDNSILRNLLIKWLRTKNYQYRDAVDGRDGVNVFESGGRFDVVLLDLSMPLLDGIGATAEIRAIEAARRQAGQDEPPLPVRILALTGMSSLDDKRRAFEAGVDGYMVKPVAFKVLDEMFRTLGLA